MEAVKCKKLSFTYPSSDRAALTDISFDVGVGELCLVVGESGAGKSTLLKLLKKEIAPAGERTGEVCIGTTVGYVAQNVEESIVCDKVRSELSFGLTNMGLSASQIELLVAETAAYFNLESKLDCDISSLSGGERQLVNLAAVMIMKPDVLVLDEPTSQLDPVAAQRFVSMIKRLYTDFSTTIIISGHNVGELIDIADKMLIIEKSKLAFCGDVDAAIDYMFDVESPLLGTIPMHMRIYRDAKTVKQCREILKTKSLTVPYSTPDTPQVAVKIKGLCFAYSRGYDVLSRLSLNIYKGRINAIVGPNSSGKTTLLKCIAGVKKYYRGSIKSNGKVSMLCQNPYDLFTLDQCRDEVEFGSITDFLEIDYIKNQHPYDLSGGEAVRLALAKVLSTGADIILLDEPARALDPHLKESLVCKLRELCASGKTVVLVSHDIELVAEAADYVSFISSGSIITTAPRREFFSRLSFYTTSLSKITSGIAENIVSLSDLKEAGGM